MRFKWLNQNNNLGRKLAALRFPTIFAPLRLLFPEQRPTMPPPTQEAPQWGHGICSRIKLADALGTIEKGRNAMRGCGLASKPGTVIRAAV